MNEADEKTGYIIARRTPDWRACLWGSSEHLADIKLFAMDLHSLEYRAFQVPDFKTKNIDSSHHGERITGSPNNHQLDDSVTRC